MKLELFFFQTYRVSMEVASRMIQFTTQMVHLL